MEGGEPLRHRDALLVADHLAVRVPVVLGVSLPHRDVHRGRRDGRRREGRVGRSRRGSGRARRTWRRQRARRVVLGLEEGVDRGRALPQQEGKAVLLRRSDVWVLHKAVVSAPCVRLPIAAVPAHSVAESATVVEVLCVCVCVCVLHCREASTHEFMTSRPLTELGFRQRGRPARSRGRSQTPCRWPGGRSPPPPRPSRWRSCAAVSPS